MASGGAPQTHLQADPTGTGGADSPTGLHNHLIGPAAGLQNATGETCLTSCHVIVTCAAANSVCLSHLSDGLLLSSGVYFHPDLVTVAPDSTGTDTGKPRPPDDPPDR